MKIAVVLFNLGGPDSLEAVRPFLFNLFDDPAIIGAPTPIRRLLAHLISRRREKKAQGIYARMGGRSPILPQTEAQAKALETALNAGGEDQWRCFVAMRYWNPRAAQALSEVKQWGPDRVVLLPLYPQFSTTTSASSLREWLDLANEQRFHPPTSALCCWPDAPPLIEAMAGGIRPLIEEAKRFGRPRVLFSAHGLPEKIVRAGDPYANQVLATTAALASLLGLQAGGVDDDDADYDVCFQSRVGPLKWIGPYTEERVVSAAQLKRPIVMAPVAFVSEHSETLVELDIEYRELALHHGAPAYLRAPTVQADAGFIALLAGMARFLAGQGRGSYSASQANGSPAGECPIECGHCARRQKRWAEARGELSPPGINKPVDFGVALPQAKPPPGYAETPGALADCVVTYPPLGGIPNS